jgi:hypothetical protein
MDYDFFLLTTFLLQTEDDTGRMKISCLGSREIMQADIEMPKYISGVIEFDSSYIPVIDLGTAFGTEPTTIDNSTCILIVEQNYQSRRLYTGVLIRDFEEIMKLAAGFSGLGAEADSSRSVHFVLEMQNIYSQRHKFFVESHRLLSSTEEFNTNIPQEYFRFQSHDTYDFINELGTMSLVERQLVLEELAKKPELWNKQGNIMCL